MVAILFGRGNKTLLNESVWTARRCTRCWNRQTKQKLTVVANFRRYGDSLVHAGLYARATRSMEAAARLSIHAVIRTLELREDVLELELEPRAREVQTKR